MLDYLRHRLEMAAHEWCAQDSLWTPVVPSVQPYYVFVLVAWWGKPGTSNWNICKQLGRWKTYSSVYKFLDLWTRLHHVFPSALASVLPENAILTKIQTLDRKKFLKIEIHKYGNVYIFWRYYHHTCYMFQVCSSVALRHSITRDGVETMQWHRWVHTDYQFMIFNWRMECVRLLMVVSPVQHFLSAWVWRSSKVTVRLLHIASFNHFKIFKFYIFRVKYW